MISPKIVKACDVKIGDWMVPNSGKHAIQVESIDKISERARIRFRFLHDAYYYASPQEDVRILIYVGGKDGTASTMSELKIKEELKKLGVNQRCVYDTIARHPTERWFAGCGWRFGNARETQRICEALVKRGLLHKKTGCRPSGKGERIEYHLIKGEPS